ncbi:CHAT domain-containing protein [Lentzea sp. NBC_00516]|uniref:CHAT domain-containing protein n=1 Tax=Lentzea sp. NBC_00516 TaxID=2903582 RepID=UPI002E81C8B8|nr:CHAT domain-containing protein [Lentzea sp. NBC_00516]WUD29292.1 CHAT domain-containing protein [Lentzea sp. NBC_00516]
MIPAAYTHEDPVVTQAERLLIHSRHTNDVEALHQARDLLEREIARMAPGAHYRSERLSVLSRVLRDLAVNSGQVELLDLSVQAGEQAAACPGITEFVLLVALINLACATMDRFEASKQVADLDTAETAYRRCLGLLPDCQAALAGLSTVLRHRYDLTGFPSYLDERLILCRLAVKASTVEPIALAVAQAELSDALHLKHQISGDLALLQEAAEVAAVAAGCNEGSVEHRAINLNSWGNALVELYSETSEAAALDQAQRAFEASLAMLPARHRVRPAALIGLGNVRRLQFGRSGDIALVDSAVELCQEALGSITPESVDFGGALHELATSLHQRYELTGAPHALNSAIDVLRRGAGSLPDSDSFRPAVLSTLGGYLTDRADIQFDQKAATTDRDEGLRHLRTALGSAFGRGALAPVLVNNYAVGLLNVYRAKREHRLLDEAEQIVEEAFSRLTSAGRGYDLLVNTLVSVALEKAEGGAPLSVLDRPEQLMRALLASTQRNDRARTVFESQLGEILSHRLGEAQDDEVMAAELRGLWQATADSEVTAPIVRIRKATSLARVDAVEGNWDSAAEHYRTAIGLFTELGPATWRRADRVSQLPKVFAVASEAAACAIRAGRQELAVELLEQGRAVLVEHPHLERVAVTCLRRTEPGLADEYTAVMAELACLSTTAFDGHLGPALDVEHRLQVQRRQDDVLREIRALGGGLGRFLLPPPCSELVSMLGDRQVVVINVARAGSDAILVGRGAVRVVPLPGLSFDAVVRQTSLFLRCLENDDGDLRTAHAVMTWLWRGAVQPVLNALGLPAHDGRLARLWWCPTGFVHSLPLHAAGWYRARPGAWDGERVVGQSTMDHVISSYTPTIRMLVDGLGRPAPPPGPPDVLAVGLSTTESGIKPTIANAGIEAEAVAHEVGAGVLLLEQEVTHARLSHEIARHSWLHFAGHGELDQNRPDSALLIPYDDVTTGPLTSLQVAELQRGTGELAYLSACDSGRGRLDIADEPIHVAGAFQQAGFRSVISTRWPVPDRPAREVAVLFYRALLADPRCGSAAALHHAMCAVRDGRSALAYPRPFFSWAPFIHSGLQETR